MPSGSLTVVCGLMIVGVIPRSGSNWFRAVLAVCAVGESAVMQTNSHVIANGEKSSLVCFRSDWNVLFFVAILVLLLL